MSYRLGFQALVNRFVARFPENEYRYVLSLRSNYDEAPHIFTALDACNRGGDIQTVVIYHRVSDIEVCRIDGNTLFGIRLNIRSEYLKRNLHLHRRPLKLIIQNQHEMRGWLKDKPKFAQLGAAIASQIHYQFGETIFPHEANDMINEGAPCYAS